MAGGSPQRGADVAAETARDLIVRVSRPHAVAFLLMAALLNILIGLALAPRVERIGDFTEVLGWTREWIDGGNPYAPPDSLADYPPNAFVTLAPLAAISAERAIRIWIALNVLLAAATGWMASRLARFGRWRVAFAALVLMLPSFRTLNQFSIAAFAPAMAGFLIAPRYPIAGGIAIGISLMKPHIGGPALLWAIATGRWKTAAAALAVPAALFAGYALRAAEPAGRILAEHAQAIARTQNRAAGDLLPGETNLQPMLEWTGFSALSQQAIVALLLALAVFWIWRRRGEDFDLRLFAAACLVSLLALRHLGYNLLLAIPALAFLWRRTATAARVIAALSFAVLIASPPTLWRVALEPRGWTALEPLVPHAYRAVMVLLFVATISVSGSTRTRSS